MIPLKLPNLPNDRLLGRIIPLIITLAVIILTYALPQNDIKSLVVIVFLIFVFSIFKFDSRILIGYGLVLLITTAILTYGNASDAAAQIAVLRYLILTSGVVSLIIDFFRKKRFIERAA